MKKFAITTIIKDLETKKNSLTLSIIESNNEEEALGFEFKKLLDDENSIEHYLIIKL